MRTAPVITIGGSRFQIGAHPNLGETRSRRAPPLDVISIRILCAPANAREHAARYSFVTHVDPVRLTACLTASRLHAKPTDTARGCVHGLRHDCFGMGESCCWRRGALPLWLSVAFRRGHLPCLGDAGSQLGNVKVHDGVRHIVHGEPFRDIFLKVDRARRGMVWDWTGTPATVRPGPRDRRAV